MIFTKVQMDVSFVGIVAAAAAAVFVVVVVVIDDSDLFR